MTGQFFCDDIHTVQYSLLFCGANGTQVYSTLTLNGYTTVYSRI